MSDIGRQITVLPDAAFQDSSGDQEASVDKLTAWELWGELLIFSNVNFGLTQIAWIAQILGNTLAYNVLMFLTVGVGLGLFGWGIYRFFVASRSPVKLKTTWRLFLWGVGLIVAILIHYVF